MDRAKPYPYLFFTFLLVLNSGVIYCQDIIYKRDISVLNVSIKSFDGKTIIYTIPGDENNYSYYLSSISVDSIRYFDGRKADLKKNAEEKITRSKPVAQNYIELELISLATGNPYITYERLSLNGRIGFLAGLLINSGRKLDYWYLRRGWGEYLNYEPYIYFTKFGFNLYPYNKSLSRVGLFRISTGLSIHAGLYRAINWNYYYQNGFIIKEDRLDAFSLMSNTKCKLYLGNNFQIYTGLDFSVFPCMTFFCPQVGISAGF